MLSTPHLLVGATVGSFSPNPLVGFIAGFLSHFVMDMIPHYDWKPSNLKLVLITFAEFFFGMAYLFFLTQNSTDPFLIWAGAGGGVFPDILQAPHAIFHRKIGILEPLRRFHGGIQKLSTKFPIYAGVLTQVITLVITSLFLIR